MSLVLRYDPDGTVSYGYYRCQDCGSSFFGGGPALHNKGCARDSYEGLEYYLGDKAIGCILDGTDRINPVTAADVRAQLPDVAARLEGKPS